MAKTTGEDKRLTFGDLAEQNRLRCEEEYHPLKEWSPNDWLGAVAGEVGELAGELKKLRRGDVVGREVIAKEAADVVIYLDLLCQRCGIDLGSAVAQKFNEVSDRVGSSRRLRN